MIEKLAHDALNYPLDTVPAPGEAIPVAPGVLWLRMRLTFVLDHINVGAAGW